MPHNKGCEKESAFTMFTETKKKANVNLSQTLFLSIIINLLWRETMQIEYALLKKSKKNELIQPVLARNPFCIFTTFKLETVWIFALFFIVSLLLQVLVSLITILSICGVSVWLAFLLQQNHQKFCYTVIILPVSWLFERRILIAERFAASLVLIHLRICFR